LSNPRIVLPRLAAIALSALLWLAFHDRSVEAPSSSPVPSARAIGPAR
jgi:hypothetical protein